MKANAGGLIRGEAIIGRNNEIERMWDMLDRKSIIFTAERRVGKTSIMRKMLENPREGWEPIIVLVESVQHPIECVQKIHQEVDRLKIRSSKAVWAGRFNNAWNTIARVQYGKWSLPEIRSGWKDLLK